LAQLAKGVSEGFLNEQRDLDPVLDVELDQHA
jgi:hypothetical protein